MKHAILLGTLVVLAGCATTTCNPGRVARELNVSELTGRMVCEERERNGYYDAARQERANVWRALGLGLAIGAQQPPPAPALRCTTRCTTLGSSMRCREVCE